ncbi:protease I [Acetoanaerobium pronyense]|uniref:Protease I n=1 Tax=Acetoanaerobium pronyense TaxID=1482736 RepID=A0ABS4KI85_9FIRM|nr:protease I [Acetoanaerobium pronyense]
MEKGKILILVEKEFEDLEFWYPALRVQEAGYSLDIAGTEKDKEYIGKYGVPAKSDISFEEMNPDDYVGLLIPGGWAPDRIRRSDEVLNLVRKMNDQKKPIGQICHAGWVLVSADIVKGKNVTSTPAIKDDLKHAGANWSDEEVVVDGNLVSSRKPGDLPRYMEEFLKLLEK